jgi:two-component system, cell cycle response regulator
MQARSIRCEQREAHRATLIVSKGMAASDNPYSDRPSRGGGECLSSDALADRVEEEVARAERHRTSLSCLLVELEDLRAIERAHGHELAEQALAYVGAALSREYRRFDRVGHPSEREFAVVLPGADGTRGEIVARRTLSRLRAIKLEARGERRALQVAVGIATWHERLTAAQLIAAARAAAGRGAPGNTPLPSGPLGFTDALQI